MKNRLCSEYLLITLLSERDWLFMAGFGFLGLVALGLLYRPALRTYRVWCFPAGFTKITATAILEQLRDYDFYELILDEVNEHGVITRHFEARGKGASSAPLYLNLGSARHAAAMLLRTSRPAESIYNGRRYRISAKKLRAFAK